MNFEKSNHNKQPESVLIKRSRHNLAILKKMINDQDIDKGVLQERLDLLAMSLPEKHKQILKLGISKDENSQYYAPDKIKEEFGDSLRIKDQDIKEAILGFGLLIEPLTSLAENEGLVSVDE